jgi:hypothetical protein
MHYGNTLAGLLRMIKLMMTATHASEISAFAFQLLNDLATFRGNVSYAEESGMKTI